jgi:predicted GH43/DUF377 family glycosyl hydrolase
MLANFSKSVLEQGGNIIPLLIPSSETNGTGLFNPSVFNDDGNLIVNIRHCQYTLYHCENEQKFPARWGGPLHYLNPENDISLTTTNFLCTLNDDFTVKKYNKVNMMNLSKPMWEFIGLEDGRLVKWDNKLYLSGVRRDTETTGIGRIELSELNITKDSVIEISRNRISPPNNANSYCEKNWMPIIDKPYQYVKWTNPTEVVKVDLNTNTSTTLTLKNNKLNLPRDIRGGSQVIPWGDYYIAITHEVDLWFTERQQKDARYYHRFIVWDKDFNIVHVTEDFNIMSAHIEFVCGIAKHNNQLVVSFGYQDNGAYILTIPENIINQIINNGTFN